MNQPEAMSQRQGWRVWLVVAGTIGCVVCALLGQPLIAYMIAAAFGNVFIMIGPDESRLPEEFRLECGCAVGTHPRGAHVASRTDRGTRSCPCGNPKGNHLNGICYAGGKALPTPALPKPTPPPAKPKLSPTFDPLAYLHPVDKAWLDEQMDLTRPLFPPPPEK